MDRITTSGDRPIQLTLNLAERSTVFVLTPRSGSAEQKPVYKTPEDRAVSPSSVLALMEDFNFFGRDDMDTNKNETKFREALTAARDQRVPIEEVLEDISVTIDEAKIEGSKFKSKPKVVRDFRRIVGSMVEDVWTEPVVAKSA